ncbi:MAG: 4Fe-4S dicluster domain-containing protein [Bacteroidetes bacterium]|nr:4Fe-4S dicluster domain-containing protein [Bacteroidota bacterium]
MSNPHHTEDNTLAGKIKKNVGVSLVKCYQCGKCSAGCPVSGDMDYPPSLLIHKLQTGLPNHEEDVLRSKSIWYCLSCEMCIARCPMEVDIPPMMDYLRGESIRLNKANPAAKNIIKFHKAFLNSIKNTGRLYEMGLIVDYKMKSLNMMQDVTLAPTMLAKGKLKIFPEMIKNRKNIRQIFLNTINKQK